MENNILLNLYKRPETVFTLNDVIMLFPSLSYKRIQNSLYYYTKIGKLLSPYHGIYAKSKYQEYELVNKLYSPSYLSFETVLEPAGVVFQHYKTIYAASYITRTIQLGDICIQYRRMKKTMLTCIDGIERKEGYFIATIERAFLDAVYVYKNYHFDNLGVINWEKIMRMLPLYKNASFENRIKSYYKLYREDYASH